MTDIPIKIQFVKALSNLKPNRLIVKKADNESVFSLFITDKNSLPFSIKDNTSIGSGIQTLINIDGTLSITSGLNKVINISPTTMAVINSALQSGDNISTLNNNVGYITLADLPDTKAEFNSLLSDGNFLFENDIFQYTDEQAQDAVGGILTDTATIDLSYNDLTNQISATVQANSITANELSDTINISEFVNDENFVTGTNLTTTHNSTNVIVNSDNGTDATISLANGITAGVSENNFTSAEKANLANQSGVNSGDQTSIVGITGTKAQFNTAVTDGDILYVGDITQYTNEDAQDAVGNILTNSSTIDFTYSDGGNTISASVKPNSITASELANTINVSEFTNDSNYINHADLSVTHNPSNVVVNSDVGADGTINLGNGTTAGVSLNNYTTAEKTKLAGIEAGITIKNTDILSSVLTTKDADGFVAYINALPSSFAVASNEIQYYSITDIGMKFMFKLNGRSFGGSEPDITTIDVLQFGLDYFDNHFFKDYQVQSRGDATLTTIGATALSATGTAANIVGGSGIYANITHKTGVTSATATAGSSCGYREGSFKPFNFTLGFKINFKFANSDAATVSDARCFVGCYLSNSQIGNVNPSTLLNMFGIGSDNGETNFSIMHNDGSGTATKIPLGINFPANTSKVDVYSVTFWVYPGTTTLYYEVKRENTGHIASGKITTDINTSAVFAPHFFRNNGSTALAVNQTFISLIAKLPF